MQDFIGKPVTLQNFIPKLTNRICTIFQEFWLMVLKIVGLIPIHTFRKLFYFISGINMSWSTTIHTGAEFFKPNNIKIGQDTIIGKNCFLDGRGELSIGNHVDIATDVLIYTDQHDINSPNFNNQYGKVVIYDYVFIGPRVIILPGTTINQGAIIAAGAVVTKDIPENEIWAGVPAQKIGVRKISKYSYKLGRPVLFQ